MAKKIYIDAGHGGTSIGAIFNGRVEQDDCLYLALSLGEILESYPDIEVKQSRTTNEYISLEQRCNEANEWGADYFISLHRNASAKNNMCTGVEGWVCSDVKYGSKTYNKAATIVNNLVITSGYKNLGIKIGAPGYSDFVVNESTNMPSVVLNVGFINTGIDNAVFDTKFREMVLGIAQGIVDAMNEQYLLLDNIKEDKIPNDMKLILIPGIGLEGRNGCAYNRMDTEIDYRETSMNTRIVLRESVTK